MADENNNGASVNSSFFPENVRAGVLKRPVSNTTPGKRTRGIALRYLDAAKHGHIVDMPVPPLTLGNFSGPTVGTRPRTQRQAKRNRKALLESLRAKGTSPAMVQRLAEIPEGGSEENNKNDNGRPNETPVNPGGLKIKSAENLRPNKKGMSAPVNVGALLAGNSAAAPAAAAPAAPAAAPALAPLAPISAPALPLAPPAGSPRIPGTFVQAGPRRVAATKKANGSLNARNLKMNRNKGSAGSYVPSGIGAPGVAIAPPELSMNYNNMTNLATGSTVGTNSNKNKYNIQQQINLNKAAGGQNAATMMDGRNLFANPYNLNYSPPGTSVQTSGFGPKYSMNFEPSSDATLSAFGTGGKASNINTGINNNTLNGKALRTSLPFGQEALYANAAPRLNYGPKNSNFANAGGNTQEAAAARVAEEKLTGNSEGRNWAKPGKSLGQIANLGLPDYTIKVVTSTVDSVPIGGEIGVSIEPKIGGTSGSGFSMPSMPSMPSWSGPKIDLSWLRLPKMPTITIPETHILESLAGFLAYLPSGKQIIAALKKGGLFIASPFLLPIIFAAWLWEHGFVFPKLDGLGGLIDLSDWFSASNDTTVKEIGNLLKGASDIAKRVITNTIAEQEFLQKQVNQKTRTQESVKDQILNSLDSQIKNIQSTFDELRVEVNKIVNNHEFGGFMANMALEANPDYDFKAPTLDKLNDLLNGVQAFYEAKAKTEDATASMKADVEKFKKIRANFKEIVELPQNIRNEIANTPAAAVGKKLKELGIKARSRLAQMGQKISQSFSNFGSRVAGVFGRQQTMSNANRAKAAAAVGRGNIVINNPIGAGNQTKKKSWRNRLSNAYSSAKSFFTRKAPAQPTGPNPGLNVYKSPKPNPKYSRDLQALVENPTTASWNGKGKYLTLRRPSVGDPTVAARTRKNRSHRR
jgi:hypothetical protein